MLSSVSVTIRNEDQSQPLHPIQMKPIAIGCIPTDGGLMVLKLRQKRTKRKQLIKAKITLEQDMNCDILL